MGGWWAVFMSSPSVATNRAMITTASAFLTASLASAKLLKSSATTNVFTVEVEPKFAKTCFTPCSGAIVYNRSPLFEFGAIIQHFKRLGLVLDDRIGVGGTSMGGFTSSALLTHHPEIKVASCMMGSPTPIQYRERLIEHASRSFNRFLPDDLRDLTAWVDRYDLSTQVDSLAGRPFFIWHGERDWRVPYDQTVGFVKGNADLDNIIFVHEDEDHLVRTETMDMMTTFFLDHL